LSYYAILVNEIPKESLVRIHNAVSAVFYVETGDPEKLAPDTRRAYGYTFYRSGGTI
jgi:hypothetical protein